MNAPTDHAHLAPELHLREVPASLIVDSRITAVKAGLDFTTDQLEAHYDQFDCCVRRI